jgi:hypothetical protein
LAKDKIKKPIMVDFYLFILFFKSVFFAFSAYIPVFQLIINTATSPLLKTAESNEIAIMIITVNDVVGYY